jgi:hypothetical protein
MLHDLTFTTMVIFVLNAICNPKQVIKISRKFNFSSSVVGQAMESRALTMTNTIYHAITPPINTTQFDLG